MSTVDVRPTTLVHRPARPGPLREGHTVVRTAKFLGRTFDYGYVVTAHEPDRLVQMQVEKPFPTVVRYELAPVADGTEVAIRATGSPDLARLRECLGG